ncbi:hypothetical protein QBE52_18690 [Clostridiaceae bacterium 35-E11]
MNNLDDRIKNALEDGIKITTEDKQEIWNNIEGELFEKKKKGDLQVKSRYTRFIAAAAAVVVLIIGTQTEIGHGIIDQIKELFMPQKQITQDIEGDKEKTNINLQYPREADYVIYVDEERYRFVEGQESDKIVMKNPNKNLPEVSMKIKQVVDQKPEDLIKDLEESIKKEYATVQELQKVNDPITAWKISGLDGQKWDSPIIKVYVVSNGNEGSFIITQQYFLEAEEGHGVRFDEMIKEFHLIEESPKN